MRAANLVLVARVAAVSYGLADGIPGALLEVQPQEVLRAAKPLPDQRHFVIVPVGSFTLAGKAICKTSDLYPELKVDQEILLFVSDFWGEADQVLRVGQMQIIPLPEKGTVRLPWTLDTQKDPPKDRIALLGYLREFARGPEFVASTPTPGGAPSAR
jgi:hypothetical protein